MCPTLLDHQTDGKGRFRLDLLYYLALQRIDELVALLDDLVFDSEDLLTLASLLALKLPDLLLNLVLLCKCNRLPRPPTQGLDLLLGIQEHLLGGEHHVVGPLFEFLACCVEMCLVLLQGRPLYLRKTSYARFA